MKRLCLGIMLAFLSMLVLGGCAALFDGGPQNVKLTTSNGKEAKVKIESRDSVQTVNAPGDITIARSKKDITITVLEDERNITTQSRHQSKTSSWLFGDILALSPISTTIDAATGDMWKYDEVIIVPVTEKQDATQNSQE